MGRHLMGRQASHGQAPHGQAPHEQALMSRHLMSRHLMSRHLMGRHLMSKHLTWAASIHLQWEPLQIHQINLADAQQAVILGRITIVETLTDVSFPFYHRGWHAHSRFEKRNTVRSAHTEKSQQPQLWQPLLSSCVSVQSCMGLS